jgi:hypothetical protein
LLFGELVDVDQVMNHCRKPSIYRGKLARPLGRERFVEDGGEADA